MAINKKKPVDKSPRGRVKPRSPRLREIRESQRFQKAKEAYERIHYDIAIAKKKLREEDLARFEALKDDRT